MTPAQRAALRAMAKAATPGPWACIMHGQKSNDWTVGAASEHGEHGHSRPAVGMFSEEEAEEGRVQMDEYVCGRENAPGYSDATYIAACSPEVIAGLLDDLDALERGSSLARQWHDDNVAEIAELKGQVATLEAREKRLREALKHAAACRFPFCEECERLTRALAEPDAQGTGGHE